MLRIKEEIIEDEIDTNFWVKKVRPLSGDDELPSSTHSDNGSDIQQDGLQDNASFPEFRLEIFSCDVCGMQFLNYDELKDHGRVHNNKRMQKMGSGEILTDPGLLPPEDETLNPFVSSEASFKCLECLREFDTKSNFQAHLKRHGGEKRFACPHCDECFSSTNARNKHVRTHSNGKSYSCDICSSGFPDSQALKSHMSNHAKDDMFACSVCDAKFEEKNLLHEHFKIHSWGLRRSQRKLNNKNVQDTTTSIVRDKSTEKPARISENSILGVMKNGMRLRHNINHKVIRNKSAVSQQPAEEPSKRSDRLKNYAHMNNASGHKEDRVNKFYCTQCSNTYFLKSSLQRHVRTSHSGVIVKKEPDTDSPSSSSSSAKTRKGRHECKYCGQFFKHNYTLSAHVRIHTGNYLATCHVCNKGFVYTSHYNRHMRIHKGIKPYKCTICFMKFSQKNVLAGHMKKHENIEAEYVSLSHGSLEKGHLPRASSVRRKNPPPCNFEATSKAAARYHPHECEVCGAKFALRSALYGHMKAHRGNRNRLKQPVDRNPAGAYTCDECGKDFSTTQGLGTHKLTHTGYWNRQYKCRICGKGFTNLAHYRKHRSFHTNVKPYKCPECQIYFSFGSSLRRHMRAEHAHSEEIVAETYESPKLRKKKYCEICDRHFSSKYTYKSHMRLHTGDGLFKCNVCGKTFNYRSHLTIHKRIHEGIKPFKCEVCNIQFTQNSSLKKHLLTSRHLDESKFRSGAKYGHYRAAIRDIRRKKEAKNPTNSDTKDRGIFDVMMECFSEDLEVEDRQNEIKSSLRSGDTKRPSTSRWKSANLQDDIMLTSESEESDYGANENLSSDNSRNSERLDRQKLSGRRSKLVISRKKKRVKKSAQSTTEKPYHCNYCDQSFSLIVKKIMHQKRHRDILLRPFVCCVCSNSFATSAKLRDHTRKHTGEPYPCHKCGLKFKHEKNIKEHRKQHDLKKYNHPYICAVCSLGFQHEQPFMSHLQKYHSGRLSAAKNFTNRQSCLELMDHDYSKPSEDLVLLPPLSRKDEMDY